MAATSPQLASSPPISIPGVADVAPIALRVVRELDDTSGVCAEIDFRGRSFTRLTVTDAVSPRTVYVSINEHERVERSAAGARVVRVAMSFDDGAALSPTEDSEQQTQIRLFEGPHSAGGPSLGVAIAEAIVDALRDESDPTPSGTARPDFRLPAGDFDDDFRPPAAEKM
jgi:hypothetical protein